MLMIFTNIYNMYIIYISINFLAGLLEAYKTVYCTNCMQFQSFTLFN